ncbi:MAG TPA: hypothetical protein VLM79_26375 [Kofleriaceae bacterium]|nr:hypothetical protein [Kofleriaceae bacterium]
MNRRIALVGGVAAVALGAYWWLHREPVTAPAAASRSAKVDVRAVKPAAPGRPTAEKPRMVMTESGLRPQTTRKEPRTWVDPVSGAVNREILDAVPDPAAAAAVELKYRKSRLRMTLADAAAQCWGGGDSKESIELEYTLVVEKEVIRADNVRIKESSVADPTVARCIVDSVRDMRTLGDKIPDMREEQGLVMSLHDLYDRNQREAKGNAKRDDKLEPFDRPTAQPPSN